MHIVIISSTYFVKPIGNYSANSMVTLFNTENIIERPLALFCTSYNITHNATEPAYTLRLDPGIGLCRWTQHVAICPVVPNTQSLAISERTLSSQHGAIQIRFRKAYEKRIGVVVCTSPFFYFERWQTLIALLEMYRYFGADLQIYYVQSMLSEILDLLQVYEKKKIASIEPWTSLDVNDPHLGYDPNMELDMRNQAAAHTDCLLNYKASAEFIIVSDYDDVVIPRVGYDYRHEFRSFLALAPNAAGFFYSRLNANFSASWTPKDFSISKLLMRTAITDSRVGGKSVVIPSRVQTVRPHVPGHFHDGYQMIPIQYQLNAMIHFRKWRTIDKGYGFRRGRTRMHKFYTIHDFAKLPDAVNIERRFRKLIDDANGTLLFNSLQNYTTYFLPMYKCYARLVFGSGIHTCAGPVLCDIAPVKGLRCAVAKRIFEHDVIGENLFIHYSASTARLEHRLNGCSM